MQSDRLQRQIDRLLDEADEAIRRLDWATVRDRAEATLALQQDNADARAYLTAAQDKLRVLDAAQPVSPHSTAAPSTATPTSFASGRYEVKRFLGEGGKKRVYLAHDTKLDRDVAFALIKTEGLDTEGQLRITREAQSMGRLGDHPHIVPVYDIGDETGQPYLVSQLMGGGDVEGLVEQAPEHRVPREQALRIADQICQALDYAHSQGIVHRDLKPGNVWLTTDGTAKLGDFGLAVALDRSRLTQAGMMVGTVSYMPPEQATGGEVTPRSDLYSLGAMLYEMVCGRPPFIGDESVAIIGQHLNTPPVAPSWHQPGLPAGLEALILRLLEKDPSKRPESAAEVRELLASVDLRAPPPSTPAEPGEASAANPLYRRTFIAREQELRQLEGAFDAALSGAGGLTMVVGEPGIGKTALCEQLATYVAMRGGRTLLGHCYEEGSLSLPYLPFIEAMRGYVLDRDPDGLKQDLGSGAAEVARIVSEVRDRIQVELRPSSDPDEDRWRLYQATVGFLRNASAVQPLLIVIEDLHWADRGALDLLVHLSRHLQGARLLIVGTYRDAEVDRSNPLSSALAELRRASAFLRILLRGLTAAEVQRMLSALAMQEVAWTVAEAVHRQTEGNPLFIQEVVRFLLEEGLLGRDGFPGRRRVTGAPFEMNIPEGLREVIGKRLSRLSPECNRVLAIAAVIGREFEVGTLQAVAATAEDNLSQVIEEAVHVGIIEEQTRPGEIRYRFTHAFIRQTLYEELIAPRRLRLHQQVAQALEDQHVAMLQDHAVELAEHFGQSTDRSDLTKAVAYSELAAQRAMGVYAYGEAARLLERALKVQEILDPDDVSKRCDLLLALGRALEPNGEPYRVATEIAEEALALADRSGDRVRAAAACEVALSALHKYGAAMGGARSTEFRTWANRADQYANPGTAARIRADIALSYVATAEDRVSEAWRLLRRALDLGRRQDDRDALFHAAFRICVTHWPAVYDEEVHRVAEEFTGLARDGVSTYIQSEVLWHGGDVFLRWGERGRAEELWAQAERFTRLSRDPLLLLHDASYAGIRAFIDGRFEDSLAARERGIREGNELGVPLAGQTIGAETSIHSLLYLGRAEDAMAIVASAQRNARRAAIYRVLGLAYLGRHSEACTLLDETLATLPIDQTPADQLITLLEAATMLKDRGAVGLLLSAASTLCPLTTHGLANVDLVVGDAARLIGNTAEARARYDRALEVAARAAARPVAARTHLSLAELLQEAEQAGEGNQPAERIGELRGQAQQHLDTAIAEFRAMKMRPYLERALSHKGLLHA